MSDPAPAVILQVDRRLRRLYGSPQKPERDPVGQLVGTILSQATTDLQTARSYEKLRRRFPTWEEVRDAPVGAIAKQIQASGLSKQKAPRLKAALKQITRERGAIDLAFLAELPGAEAFRWLTHIDGVGPKTASIVLLFAFDKPFFPVDTHIHRVTRRLGWIPPQASADKAHALLARIVPPRLYYRLHLNLIAHGRAVCQARRPRCEVCPLTDLCRYYAESGGPQSVPHLEGSHE